MVKRKKVLWEGLNGDFFRHGRWGKTFLCVWHFRLRLEWYEEVVVQSLSCVQFFCDPMDCSTPGSSVHGISQAGILEWVAISFSREFSKLRDRIPLSCIAGGFFTTEPQRSPRGRRKPCNICHSNFWHIDAGYSKSLRRMSMACSFIRKMREWLEER